MSPLFWGSCIDYPNEKLIENIWRNVLASRAHDGELFRVSTNNNSEARSINYPDGNSAHVLGYLWGSPATELQRLSCEATGLPLEPGFDVVIMGETLWLHNQVTLILYCFILCVVP